MKTKLFIFGATLLLIAGTGYAQQISGTIRFKKAGLTAPDGGAQIYLCLRTKELTVDRNKIALKEAVLKEYNLSQSGSGRQMAKHKNILLSEYTVADSTDISKYISEAENEEKKIISFKNVQMTVADSKGFYKFDSIIEGNYLVLIKSAHSPMSHTYALDALKNDLIDISYVME